MHLNIFTVQKKCYAALAIEDWQDREYFSKFGGGYYITVYVSYVTKKVVYLGFETFVYCTEKCEQL